MHIWEKIKKIFSAEKIEGTLKDIKKILKMTSKGFIKNRDLVGADVLTFYTLLAIVPFLAILFGVAKGFGFSKFIEEDILAQAGVHRDLLEQVFPLANKLLESTKGTLVAGVGLIILLWTVIKVLNNIEDSLNTIWGVKNSRTAIRKTMDYIAIIFLTPIVIILSGAINTVISSEINRLAERISFINIILFYFAKTIPIILITTLFSLIYLMFPNKKVSTKAGILAGLFSGVLYLFIQNIYFDFQIGVVRYNAVYGSFAIVPLLLIWVRISWVIILVGAEISYAIDNYNKFDFEISPEKMSLELRKKIAISIMGLIIKKFENADKPYSTDDISKILKIPLRIIDIEIEELAKAELISILKTADSDKKYIQPAVDINKITIEFIIRRLEKNGIKEIEGGYRFNIKDIYSHFIEDKNDLLKDMFDEIF